MIKTYLFYSIHVHCGCWKGIIQLYSICSGMDICWKGIIQLSASLEIGLEWHHGVKKVICTFVKYTVLKDEGGGTSHPYCFFFANAGRQYRCRKKLLRKRALSQIHFVASFVDRKQNGCGVPSTSPRIKNSCIVDIKVNNRGVEGGGSFDHGNSCFGYP